MKALAAVILTGLIAGAGMGFGVVALEGCTKSKPYVEAGKTAAIICGKEYLPEIAKLLATWGARAALDGEVAWGPIEGEAIVAGKEVGSCAVKELLVAIRKQPTVQTRSLVAGPDVAAEGEAVLARVSGGAEVRLP